MFLWNKAGSCCKRQESALIFVDVLFCNANSISNPLATGITVHRYSEHHALWETVAIILEQDVRWNCYFVSNWHLVWRMNLFDLAYYHCFRQCSNSLFYNVLKHLIAIMCCWLLLRFGRRTSIMRWCYLSLSLATWLILPVVIRSSQRLSHACLSINILLWNCERLIISVIVSLIVPYYLDTRSNSRANTCVNALLG